MSTEAAGVEVLSHRYSRDINNMKCGIKVQGLNVKQTYEALSEVWSHGYSRDIESIWNRGQCNG